MKITSLHIRKLHKHYDYDVEFNKDVTFLYGTNGCGKTTILNITEALISGHLYKLFEYDFDEIILFYSNDISSDNSLFIRIKKINREMIAEYKYMMSLVVTIDLWMISEKHLTMFICH